MKSPYYREETWRAIQEYLPSYKQELNGEHPGALAYEAGIVFKPELLRDTVVLLEDECEYLIDQTAAEAIASSEPIVTLRRLGDQKPKQCSLQEVLDDIRFGAVFDQLPLS